LDPKRHYNPLEIVLLKFGMISIPFFIVGISLYLFFTEPLYISLRNYYLYPNQLMLNYSIRFLIFVIPATIAIFTFVYKEKKDASYSNLKTSNITQWFICTICFEVLALFFSITTITEFPDETTKSLIGYPNHHYQMSIIFTFITLVAMIAYSTFLFIHMDIHYSFKFTSNKNVRLHRILKYFYKNENSKYNINYNYLFNSYNHMLESNFQLVIAAISKKNLSNVEDEIKKLFALTKDFYSTFIDVSSLKYLSKLLNEKNEDKMFIKDISIIKKFLNQDETNEEALENSVKYQEKLIEVYKTILYSYKMIIREASKNHVTDIQKLAYIELSALNPIKLFKFNINEIDGDTFVNVYYYYLRLSDCYQAELFETIKEFSDEKSVEYSYLLNHITSSVKFFESINTLEKNESEYQLIFYTSLINKEINLIQSLLVRAVEINNVRFLTESMRLLLDLYYTHVKKPDDIEKTISKKLKKENEIFERYVPLTTNSNVSSKKYNGVYRELIAKSILKIILHSLYKSIELNNYGCTGYLIKVSVSHITMKNYLKEIQDFIQIIIERKNLIFNMNYFHYSFNSYSKIHCIQKMVLLLAYQFIYRYGHVHKNDLQDIVKIVFLENKDDLNYMLEKIDSASKSYGMVSITDKTKSIKQVIQQIIH
jgi:hypothetical protein